MRGTQMCSANQLPQYRFRDVNDGGEVVMAMTWSDGVLAK